MCMVQFILQKRKNKGLESRSFSVKNKDYQYAHNALTNIGKKCKSFQKIKSRPNSRRLKL